MTLREKALAMLMLVLLNVATLSFGAAMGVLGLVLAGSFLVLSVAAATKILSA